VKVILQKFLLAIVIILFFLSGVASAFTTPKTKHVSTLDIKYLLDDPEKDHYRVTCNNKKQHIIIFNPAEQDFQYYYPQKGNYINYDNADFNDLIYFARWVCSNNN
jgi:hypothetical protein